MNLKNHLSRLIILGVTFLCLFCVKFNAKTISEGIYTIQSAVDSNKFLDINECSKEESTKMQLWEKNDTDAQKFYIYKSKDGCFRISAVCSGKLITCLGNDMGSEITQNMCNNSDNQKWSIYLSDDDSVSFCLKSAGMYLDVNGANSENGTKIQLWERNGTDAQKFYLVPLKEFHRDDYIVSTKKEDIQIDKITDLMKHLGKNYSSEKVKSMIDNSQICFGVYSKAGNQLGFARVITDYETTCFIMNVVIDSSCRGKGLGLKLMQSILENDELKKCRFSLISSSEKVARLYGLLGFASTGWDYMIAG